MVHTDTVLKKAKALILAGHRLDLPKMAGTVAAGIPTSLSEIERTLRFLAERGDLRYDAKYRLCLGRKVGKGK